jgi:type IV secretion system protein VirB6
MVGWQLPAVASGLAGGATLAGFGAFVAGLASRQVIRGFMSALHWGHGERRPGGAIYNRGGSGGDPGGSTGSPGVSGEVLAYQRAAREHLGGQGD